MVQQLISLILYGTSSVIIIWAAESHRGLLRRLRAEDSTRQLLNHELAHRIKNILANVQAIVSLSLRGQKDVLDMVSARIAALGATHDLLVKSGWRGASLREILIGEFAPYGLSRFELKGQDVECPCAIVTVLALMFHELTTNAVKYGALSRPEGRVSVSWINANGRLDLEWVERGGPQPAPPIAKGFGTRLLQSGLKPFCGSADMRLERAGVSCSLSLTFGAPEF